jgi:hypothetical protein
MMLYHKPAPADEPPPTTYFDMFVSSTQELLRGELDATSYEDRMRAAYGIHSYITVTLDKLVRSCARQVGIDKCYTMADTASDPWRLFVKKFVRQF